MHPTQAPDSDHEDSSTAAAPTARPVRDRKRPLRVVVSAEERAEIERRAELTGLSLSAYLRSAGLSHPIRSSLDFHAVRELAQVAGDLGRLGGLLKLWLAEKRGQGAPVADVNKLLRETRALQDAIRDRMGRL